MKWLFKEELRFIPIYVKWLKEDDSWWESWVWSFIQWLRNSKAALRLYISFEIIGKDHVQGRQERCKRDDCPNQLRRFQYEKNQKKHETNKIKPKKNE